MALEPSSVRDRQGCHSQAALYATFRVALFEAENGKAIFEHGRSSYVFRLFGDPAREAWLYRSDRLDCSERSGIIADRPRNLAVHPRKRETHPFPIGKSHLSGDHLDRQPTLLQHQLRGLDSQRLDRLRRRRAGFRAEEPRELARAEAGSLGKILDREALDQVLAGEIQRALDPVLIGAKVEQRGMLGLAARTAMGCLMGFGQSMKSQT